MTKQAVLTAVVVAAIGAGTFAATNAFAQSPTIEQNSTSSLVQKISDKFGLNKSDVQAIFDQEKQEHHAKMETAYTAQLTQYVKDGKITEAQKQLLLDKHKELKANLQEKMQSMQNMTPEERKSAKQKDSQALTKWAKENGIDLKYIMPHGPRDGHGWGHRMKGEKSSTATTSPAMQ